MSEQFTFQAEIKQLLHTLIHSLYTDREIFLRELLSNSSDALHRVQFEMLTNEDVVSPDAELGVWLEPDAENGTLTIHDTGIGMNHDELVSNLGTISKSGIKSFMEQMQASENGVSTDLIGQFGVGFYSIFMVADRVEVVSRSANADDEVYRWISEGDDQFYVEPADRDERGTSITLFLKEDAKEFLRPYRLREVIKKHSNYIPFPIYVLEPPADVAEDAADDEEEKEEKAPEPINAQKALWRRSDVEESEYKDFYKSLTYDFTDPLFYTHINTDAPVQFYSVLYIPQSAEKPIFSQRQEPGLQLYARKVLIQDYCNDLLPEYLQFVQGVVDSEDLPLNVSRETVQANRVMANLKNAITGRVLRELKRLADKDAENYLKFWEEFGAFMKHGVIADMENKDKLVDLLRFKTTHSAGEYISLADYAEHMKDVEGQDEIYYVVADSLAAAQHSPHLDPFRDRDMEVLYFVDTVDSFLINALRDYQGHKLHNIDDEKLDLSEIEATDAPEDEENPVSETDMDAVLARFADVLGERVTEVRISKVLTGKSPARLVSPEGTLDRHTQRVYKMLNQEYQVPQKILELNSRHALTHNVVGLLSTNADNPMIDMTIEQIYENALLLDGLHPNPAEMVERIQSILEAATHQD